MQISISISPQSESSGQPKSFQKGSFLRNVFQNRIARMHKNAFIYVKSYHLHLIE